MESRVFGRTKLNVSRIGLGTAEIGFAYGLGNPRLVSEKEAITLLKSAVDMGITYFDTANFYGLAEERIGKSGIAKCPGVTISTKCGQFLEDGENPGWEDLNERLRIQVEESLRNLKIDCVPVLMLHGGSKKQIESGEIVAALKRFKIAGKAMFLGISARGEEAALAAIESDAFDVVQVAFSILDQRMAERVFPSALERNVGIVCRSIFLKGVLAGRASHLPLGLDLLKLNAVKAETIGLDELDCCLAILALRFGLSQAAISTILVGTGNAKNLKDAVSTVGTNPLPADIIFNLKKLAINDPELVDPFRWRKE